MKKTTLFGLPVIFLALGLAVPSLCFGQWWGIQTQPYEADSKFVFEDTGEKPEKKTPERQGNFEIIQGRQIKAPIDKEKFIAAVKVSLAMLQANKRYDVAIQQEGTGFIFFRARNAPAWVEIKLCYWDDEYWYEYWDSYKMNAVPLANKIHKSYRGTIIASLEKELKTAYRK
ncbi:MAG: hypothetical protein LBQ93_08495 [Treponema sp.]|jgi:hypothetical protein|nr:hypothetical protein [Treponema sp.]